MTTLQASSSPKSRFGALPRYTTRDLLPHLPAVHRFRIEINGCLAGSVEAIDEAPRELGVGWAFMHRFIEPAAPPARMTVARYTISMMTPGGVDIERTRFEAVGWDDDPNVRSNSIARRRLRAPMWPAIDVLAMVERAFRQFDPRERQIGFVHAALVTDEHVRCVARDVSIGACVAKVLGWAVGDDEDVTDTMLVVEGVPDERIVLAAARLGLSIVAMDGMPTAGATRVADRCGVSLLALAMTHRRGLIVDSGHIGDEAG